MNNFIKMNFDIVVASDVGTDAAIIFSNIQFWVSKNKANNKNFHDGKHWTYNSAKAWLELFPYLTESKIRTCLTKLESKKYIEVGNYNKKGYDRTKWFYANDTVNCDSYQMQLLKMPNAIVKTIRPIPDNKPDNKTDIVQFSFSIDSKKWSTQHIEQGFDLFWDKYGLKQSRSVAFTSWKKVCKNGDAAAAYNGIDDYEKHLKILTWKQKQMPSTWLNQKNWLNEYDFAATVKIEKDDFVLNNKYVDKYIELIENGKYPALRASKTKYICKREFQDLQIYREGQRYFVESEFNRLIVKCLKELNMQGFTRNSYLSAYDYIKEKAKEEINNN